MDSPPRLCQVLRYSAALWSNERETWDSQRVDDSLAQVLECHEPMHELSFIQGYRPEDFLRLWHNLSAQWSAGDDTEDVKKVFKKHFTGQYPSHDLLSFEVFNCSRCYKFFNRRDRPKGRVMACLKAKESKRDERNLLVFECSPSTLFDVCQLNEQWFRSCCEQFPELPLPRFEPHEVHKIFQFIDVRLAGELSSRGIKLWPSCWSGAMHQENPDPILDWLQQHGPLPPPDYLLSATSGFCFPAARWILQNQEVNYEDWKEATFTANNSDEAEAVDMLKVILQYPHPQRHDAFFIDLLIRIVENACLASGHLERDSSEFLALEERTVAKIHVLDNEKVDILWLKFRTDNFGLHKVTEALESLRAKACTVSSSC